MTIEKEKNNRHEKFEKEKISVEKIKEKIGEINKEELTQEEKIIKEHIEKQIAQLKISPKTEKNAQIKWEKIKDLEIEQKLFELLKIAKNKGVFFATSVAQKSNDPYLLDLFHDILVKNQYYKNFPH